MSFAKLADEHHRQTGHKVKCYGRKVDKYHGHKWYKCSICDWETTEEICADINGMWLYVMEELE